MAGSHAIAQRLTDVISRVGSVWTVDSIVVDRDRPLAVVEWTNFKTLAQGYMRGDEWIRFDADSGLIDEIRPYYAASPDPSSEVNELGGFDYQQRGYPLAPPFSRNLD